MQGFYVNMVYHSYAMAYGGDKAVLNETGWVQDWVSLMTQVQESDVCQVHACLALVLSTSRILHCWFMTPQSTISMPSACLELYKNSAGELSLIVHCLNPDACDVCSACPVDFSASCSISSAWILGLSFGTFCAHAPWLLMASLCKVSSHHATISDALSQWLMLLINDD